jgi:hypothetical protein
MPRSIVIDKTVIEQLNRDNKDLANFFNSLHSVNLVIINSPHLRMTAETYAKLNEAEQQLCKDMGVKPEYSDRNSIDSFRHRTDNNARFVEQWDPDAFKNIAPEHEATIALAFGSAELLTFDPKLAESYGRITARLQNKLVPELKNISVSNKPIEYHAARQNLGLRALNITPAGTVLPTPGYTRVKTGGKTVGWVTPDREGFMVAEGGPRTRGGARTTKTITAVVGDHEPVQAPKEFGPAIGGDAAMNVGATVVLQGINYGLSKINGPIQQRRFDEVWNRRRPYVEQRLNEDPQLGAMVYVYYSTYQAGEASAIDGGLAFQDVQVAYGFTPDDAQRAYDLGSHVVAGGQIQIGDQIWHKPKAPLDVRRLRLPYGTTVAGLATFVPGKEKLVRVRFRTSWGGGFDDRLHSRETLDVPKGMTPRFFYLWPPEKINYRFGNGVSTQDIDWAISDDADESAAEIDVTRKLNKGIPVVKLDSHINPSTWFSEGATAAMIWPADNATANLFQTTAATLDNNNYLGGLGYRLVRWVRPEFVRVLKDPVD